MDHALQKQKYFFLQVPIFCFSPHAGYFSFFSASRSTNRVFSLGSPLFRLGFWGLASFRGFVTDHFMERRFSNVQGWSRSISYRVSNYPLWGSGSWRDRGEWFGGLSWGGAFWVGCHEDLTIWDREIFLANSLRELDLGCCCDEINATYTRDWCRRHLDFCGVVSITGTFTLKKIIASGSLKNKKNYQFVSIKAYWFFRIITFL